MSKLSILISLFCFGNLVILFYYMHPITEQAALNLSGGTPQETGFLVTGLILCCVADG